MSVTTWQDGARFRLLPPLQRNFSCLGYGLVWILTFGLVSLFWPFCILHVLPRARFVTLRSLLSLQYFQVKFICPMIDAAV